MPNQRSLGLIGLILGAVAIGAALVHVSAGPFETANKFRRVTNKVAEFRDNVAEKLNGERRTFRVDVNIKDRDQQVTIGTVVGGVLAILLAFGMFSRREERRVALAAMLLGAGAILLEFLNWHVIMVS
jgi:hypothetical protein